VEESLKEIASNELEVKFSAREKKNKRKKNEYTWTVGGKRER